jgi:shikimate dehydrogenase
MAAKSRRVVLLGWPVAHSVSPAMHNAAFRVLGLDWAYELRPVPPRGLAAAVESLRGARFGGANVTVPHKQAIIPWLDGIDDDARGIGAVNTVVPRDGRLWGYNTDAGGFLTALDAAGFRPAGRRGLLLGAGGAARAVAYALASAGCQVSIHNRTPQRARRLAADLADILPDALVGVLPAEMGLAGLEAGDFDLLVNATSLGMWPRPDASPWPEGQPIPARWMVFDLVYNPLETRLLRQARAAGAQAIDGLGMLVHQGALAFTLWTGRTAPIDRMYSAALQALAEK